MELNTENINWVISAVVGIFSSLIGAFIFWGFQKFAVGRSVKKRHQKLEEMKNKKELYEKLNNNSSYLLIHFLGILFYIFFISFLSSSIGYLGAVFHLDFFLDILRIGLYLGAALLAFQAFSDLSKIKRYDETMDKIQKEIKSLESKP